MTEDAQGEAFTAPAIQERLLAERKVAERHLLAVTGELAELARETEGAAHDDEHDPEGSTIAYERARVTGLHQRASDATAIDR